MALAQKGLAAANANVVAEVSDSQGMDALLDVTGTFTGLTLELQGTVDNTVWRVLALLPVGGGAAVTSVAAAGAWLANVSGFLRCRAIATAIATGSASVRLNVVRR